MSKFNRISTKLGAAVSLGLLVAAGLVANQQMSGSDVIAANKLAVAQQEISRSAVSTETGLRRMQLAVRDMRLAKTQPEVDKAGGSLQASKAFADQHVDAALKQVARPENRDRFQKVKALLDDYTSAALEIAKLQSEYFALVAKRNQDVTTWKTNLERLLGSATLAKAVNRVEVEATARHADALFQEIRSSTWRYSSTGEDFLVRQVADDGRVLTDLMAQLRGLAKDPDMLEAIASLTKSEKDYLAATEATFKMEASRADFVQNRTLPIADQTAALIETTVNTARKIADETQAEATNEISAANTMGLAFGAIVMTVLIGTIIFSVFGIARPLTRLNGAMGRMAAGELNIEIPGAARGDEVGDMARTISVIRQNAERDAIEKQEAGQREEATRAQQRKADMMKLAGDFEGAVGEIIHTVSSAATELEASANTLTSTAARTEELSTVVAAAAEEASTNVQSVASASEEMASSVNEISRQVQESARIASEAVSQAEQTNARVGELSDAAKKIGDVVKLISTIAEQTNLLALNATIEAARAGEAGRGFAVVASEVKALAEQTSKATGEIGGQIAAIQTATEGSVEAIREIGITIGRISEIASTIAAAVEEQGAATQEISRNVQQASRGTTDVAANISDVQRGSIETGSASSQVLSSAQSLSVESNRLKSEVGRFLATVRAA